MVQNWGVSVVFAGIFVAETDAVSTPWMEYVADLGVLFLILALDLAVLVFIAWWVWKGWLFFTRWHYK